MDIPAITVEKIDKNNIHKIQELMVTHSHFFIQFFGEGHCNAEVVDGSIFLFNMHEDVLVAKLGDYYVTSENGTRIFTDKIYVRHGIFEGFPSEMFTPFYGEPTTI